MSSAPSLSAEELNRGCGCRTLDAERLRRQLEAEPALAGLHARILATRPHLFSSTAVFVTPQQVQVMEEVVAAVERVVSLPAWQQTALARSPAIARRDFGPRGVFLGFDFHLGPEGPRLIEINTNAGGALLNAVLARAQAACCREMEWAFGTPRPLAGLEAVFVAMFREEWLRQRQSGGPRRLAIVDDAPATQYLHPEFLLFARLFAREGWEARIVDASALTFEQGRLWAADADVDLVYNRLTDFHLEAPEHAALRAAYEAGAVVLTPHPRAHALYADKRNLILLCDADALLAIGAREEDARLLAAHVPPTVAVTAENAQALWESRRRWFFKPVAGFGSRAAYRGDKLTRRVWGEIVRGNYVAQAIAPPSERLAPVDGGASPLKLDVRAYAYAGGIQLFAARLYAGQTTNFRTPGGGFAPVFVAPA